MHFSRGRRQRGGATQKNGGTGSGGRRRGSGRRRCGQRQTAVRQQRTAVRQQQTAAQYRKTAVRAAADGGAIQKNGGASSGGRRCAIATQFPAHIENAGRRRKGCLGKTSQKSSTFYLRGGRKITQKSCEQVYFSTTLKINRIWKDAQLKTLCNFELW